MDYFWAFIIGGIICAIGQVLIDKTKLTSSRILVLFVVVGCILGGLGIYDKIAEIGGAGASVPLTGFGNTLARGVKESVDKEGFIGIFTGGMKAGAAGITSAVLFAFFSALIFNPKDK